MSVKAHELIESPDFWAAEINKMNGEIGRLRSESEQLRMRLKELLAALETLTGAVRRNGLTLPFETAEAQKAIAEGMI